MKEDFKSRFIPVDSHVKCDRSYELYSMKDRFYEPLKPVPLIESAIDFMNSSILRVSIGQK